MPRPLAALAAALLASCTGGGFVESYQSTRYNPTEVLIAGRDGAIPLRVLGSPFAGVTAGQLAPGAARAMSDVSARLPPTRFAPETAATRNASHRMVLAFVDSAGGDQLCRADASEGRAMHAVAVFCTGERRLSSASANLPRISGPDDPAFAALLHNLAAAALQVPPLRSSDSRG
jgi:hypothetical protein